MNKVIFSIALVTIFSVIATAEVDIKLWDEQNLKLADAIVKSDVRSVKDVIAQGVDINAVDSSLHYQALDVAWRQLAAKFDPEIGVSAEDREIYDVLIANGAQYRRLWGRAGLHDLARFELLEEALGGQSPMRKIAPCNNWDERNDQLFEAIRSHNSIAVEDLTKGGINVNAIHKETGLNAFDLHFLVREERFSPQRGFAPEEFEIFDSLYEAGAERVSYLVEKMGCTTPS
jgi:hypothetical protein